MLNLKNVILIHTKKAICSFSDFLKVSWLSLWMVWMQSPLFATSTWNYHFHTLNALKHDIVKTLTWTTLLFTGCLIPLSWLIYSVYSAAVTQSVDSHWLFHSSLNHQPRSTKNCLHSANNSNRMNDSIQSGLPVWSLCFNNLLNGFSFCLHITPPPFCLSVSVSSGASEGWPSTFARHQRHRLH